MRFGIFVILLLSSINSFGKPKKFVAELKVHMESVNAENQLMKRRLMFHQFMLSQSSNKKSTIALEYLTPIQEHLREHPNPNAKTCLELQKQMRYDSLIGLPEAAKLPEIAQLSIQLANSLCPVNKKAP